MTNTARRRWIKFPYGYFNPGGRPQDQTYQIARTHIEEHGLHCVKFQEVFDQDKALNRLAADGLKVIWQKGKNSSHNALVFDPDHLTLQREISIQVRPHGIFIGKKGAGIRDRSVRGYVVGGEFLHKESGRTPVLLSHHGQSSPRLPLRIPVARKETQNVANVHETESGLCVISGDYNYSATSLFAAPIRKVADIDALESGDDMPTFARKGRLDFSSHSGPGFHVKNRLAIATPPRRDGKLDHKFIVAEGEMLQARPR